MKYKSPLPYNYIIVLVFVTLFDLVILFIRNMVEQTTTYNFLLWNLFLAFVPLFVAWVVHFSLNRVNKIIVVILSIVWLMFYPNAPYMISDLIHVNAASTNVLYDTLIIFSFSILALFYGFYSLKIIHVVYKSLFGSKVAIIVAGTSIILSSAGIYLGRILRLNSWDFFTNFFGVMKIIFDHLFPVTKNPSTYVIILLFSIIQFILLMMIKDLDDIEKESIISNTSPA